MPLLKSVFEQTREQGVDFVGISLDHELDKLDALVANERLPWAQLGDPRGRRGRLAELFNVRGTPTYYLLDSEGRIAGKGHESAGIIALLGELIGKPIDEPVEGQGSR